MFVVEDGAVALSFDDHLERLRFGRVAEGVVGIEDVIKLEAMGNQSLGVDLGMQQS